MPCTPVVDELPSVHRVLRAMAYDHAADLLIVDPASTPAPRWSGARRDVAGFLAACDLPVLQLRSGTAHAAGDAAVRPWHVLSGGGTTPADIQAG